MKLRIMLLLTTIILVLTVVSCLVTSRDIHVDIPCDDFVESPSSMRNDFEIEIGDKIYIELCSNPTTGFEWAYEMSSTTVVKEEDHDFDAPEGDVPGASGIEKWTFEGIGKGTTTITMEYSQPWDGGIKGEWKYIITVVIE